MRRGGLVLVLILLQACGNTGERSDIGTSVAALASLPKALLGRKPAPPDPAVLRAELAKGGQPVISVAQADLPYASFMVPYYPTKGAQTWSSATYETVTLRDGLLEMTRGLGPDLMASQGPSLGQVASASGEVRRVMEYLDGGDQVVTRRYDCDLAPGGAERIIVLGRAHDTSLVVETCRAGNEVFENRYWFESGKIRQSQQLLAPGVAPLLIQQIIP